MTNTEATEPIFEFFFDSDDGFAIRSSRPDAQGYVLIERSAIYGPQLYRFQPNAALFQASLDQITNHPETWNQCNWLSALKGDPTLSAAPECGTAGCLAGTASLLSGARPHSVWDDDDERGAWNYVLAPGVAANPDLHRGGVVAVRIFAEDALGIEYPFNDMLFYAGNTLAELWEMAQVICGGQLTVPERSVIEAAQEISWHLYGREGAEV